MSQPEHPQNFDGIDLNPNKSETEVFVLPDGSMHTTHQDAELWQSLRTPKVGFSNHILNMGVNQIPISIVNDLPTVADYYVINNKGRTLTQREVVHQSPNLQFSITNTQQKHENLVDGIFRGPLHLTIFEIPDSETIGSFYCTLLLPNNFDLLFNNPKILDLTDTDSIQTSVYKITGFPIGDWRNYPFWRSYMDFLKYNFDAAMTYGDSEFTRIASRELYNSLNDMFSWFRLELKSYSARVVRSN